MSAEVEPPSLGGAGGRYVLGRSLGAGGMGVVYEAYDRERRQSVALKTLRSFDPPSISRFKQEFRTLADVAHPNLVRLYELVASGETQIFFTMELVSGTDFLGFVRRADAEPPEAPPVQPLTFRRATHREEATTAPHVEAPDAARPFLRRPRGGRSPADFDRLRPAFAQLALGVHALHVAGKLHRDIKPSNVRVTPEGRVVLLDFGVAIDLARVVDESLAEHEIVGTVTYMAPEQWRDLPPTPASDWYSAGVMLYQALVGCPPFEGSASQVLAAKMAFAPIPPRELLADVPADLDALCCDLLQRDPTARPSGGEVLRRAQAGAARDAAFDLMSAAPARAALVGREEALRALRAALEEVRGERGVTVRVHGLSGMGKSALVQRFLEEVARSGDAITLRGRAYERESVPYKAFDSVIDALSRYLRRLSEEELQAVLPAEVWALARLFPVLRRVAAIDASEEPAVADLGYMRRRAFAALRELFARLGALHPVVVYIDDLQWGDVDSAALILEIVRPPSPPPILIVTAYQEEAQSSAVLRELLARWPARAELCDVPVGPLAVDDARRLASTLLARREGGPPDDAEGAIAASIARESGGSPFLVEELARSVSVAPRVEPRDGPREAGAGTLERMLRDRLASVPEPARRLLEIVAVAARPLDVSIAGASAALHTGLDDSVAALRAARFVRTGLRDGREVVETVHDRIRGALVAQLSPAVLREHHRRLSRTLEALPATDPEALALHFLGAGETASAARYAELAAEHAIRKLAFAQAARLYTWTLEIAPAPDVRRLRVRRAEALKLAGRGAEAAHAYMEAAEGATALERIDLEREAADQLITSGHLDEGVLAMRRVLAAVGLAMATTPLGAVVRLLVYRVLFWLYRARARERDAAEVRPEDRARIDVCASVAMGLSLVDAIQGMSMQAQHLLLATRLGDRLQLVRALTLEAAHAAALGGQNDARASALAEATCRIASRTGAPEARFYVEGMRGIRLFLSGRWKEAREQCDVAVVQAIPDDRTGWRNNVQLVTVWSLCSLGELAELGRRVPALVADAESRGDLHAAVNLRLGFTNLVWLAADDVDEARRQVESGMASWSRRSFSVQHFRALVAETNVDLYAGLAPRAYERVASRWRALERSFLLRVQLVRGDAYFLRARCALAAGGDANGRARIAEATRAAARLERERMPWTAPLAHLVRACIARARGDDAATERELRAAAARADAADMAMHAAVARYRLGALVGGDEGRALSARAAAWASAEGVRSPERLAAMVAPWGAPRERTVRAGGA